MHYPKDEVIWTEHSMVSAHVRFSGFHLQRANVGRLLLTAGGLHFAHADKPEVAWTCPLESIRSVSRGYDSAARPQILVTCKQGERLETRGFARAGETSPLGFVLFGIWGNEPILDEDFHAFFEQVGKLGISIQPGSPPARAPRWARFRAFVLDYLIWVCTAFVFWGLYYGLARDGFAKGSFGKRRNNLRVVRVADGSRCTKPVSALRRAPYLLWFLFALMAPTSAASRGETVVVFALYLLLLVDAGLALWQREGRCLGDFLAGTKVEVAAAKE